MSRIFGIKKNVFFLGVVSLLNDFSNEMVQSVMPVFLTSVLGAPIAAVGIIEGSAEALSSLVKVGSGWWSDKIGKRKKPAVVGYSLSVGVRFFLSLVTNVWHVFGLRLIDRVGKGIREAPRDALLAESVEKNELGKSFGYHRMMDTVGSLLGPAGAFLLLPALNGNYRILFSVAGVIGMLSIASFAFVKEKNNQAPQKVTLKGMSVFVGNNRKFKLFLIAVFVFGLGSLPVALILLRSQELGSGSMAVPFFYLVYSMAFVVASLPFGKLSDQVGKRKVIVAGFGLALAAYALLAVTHSKGVFICALVLLGLSSAATDGIERALTAKIVSKEEVATGEGFLNAAIGISALVAGVVGGIVWNLVNANAAFFYSVVMSVCGIVLFIHLTLRKEN